MTKLKSKSLSRLGFEKNENGVIVRKAKGVGRKGYVPKPKQSGTPNSVRVNSREVDIIEDGFKLHVAPISVNDAWQGQRYKTPYYEQYEDILESILPTMTFPPQPWKIFLEWGFSHTGSDWDNPIKMFMDILQKKYGFNDNKVYDARVIKKAVGKGKEFIVFKVKTFNTSDEIIF